MCQKLKLPFKYGRIVLSDLNIAFIKVGMSTSTIYNIVPMGSQKKHPKAILIISILLAVFKLNMLLILGIFVYRIGDIKGSIIVEMLV